jgi:hypothetical protein
MSMPPPFRVRQLDTGTEIIDDRVVTDRTVISEVILKDVFDGVEYFFGKEGLDQVTNFALLKNRDRESNHIMDELERLYGPVSSGARTLEGK